MSLENEDSGLKEHFFKKEYSSSFTGTEQRRPGVPHTDIVLAFPVRMDSGIWVPKPTSLPTFAYLPLGEFGFKVSRLV
jgi:hypothetical protein